MKANLEKTKDGKYLTQDAAESEGKAPWEVVVVGVEEPVTWPTREAEHQSRNEHDQT